MFSPGQFVSLQVFFSWLEPSQVSPPWAFAGLLHILLRVFSATPHVLLQVVHAPHKPQLPSTENADDSNMFSGSNLNRYEYVISKFWGQTNKQKILVTRAWLLIASTIVLFHSKTIFSAIIWSWFITLSDTNLFAASAALAAACPCSPVSPNSIHYEYKQDSIEVIDVIICFQIFVMYKTFG